VSIFGIENSSFEFSFCGTVSKTASNVDLDLGSANQYESIRKSKGLPMNGSGDWKVPVTRRQECLRYVAQAFQPASAGDFPVAQSLRRPLASCCFFLRLWTPYVVAYKGKCFDDDDEDEND
jgi:hypothetical protein